MYSSTVDTCIHMIQNTMTLVDYRSYRYGTCTIVHSALPPRSRGRGSEALTRREQDEALRAAATRGAREWLLHAYSYVAMNEAAR